MVICWERAVPLAFCSCCSYFMLSKLYVFLSYLVSRAGWGIRLYRFLIIAFSFTFDDITTHEVIKVMVTSHILWIQQFVPQFRVSLYCSSHLLKIMRKHQDTKLLGQKFSNLLITQTELQLMFTLNSIWHSLARVVTIKSDVICGRPIREYCSWHGGITHYRW